MRLPLKNLKLYNNCYSSASWRVRIVLNLKNLKYEYIPINILESEHKTPEYAQINPMKQVPTLDVDGQLLIESMAICEFLDENVPEPQLLFQDPYERAKIRGFCEMINSGIQPITNLSVLKWLESNNVNSMEWAQYWLTYRFSSLESHLKNTRGKYCFGDKVSLADVFLLPMIQGTVKRFNLDVTKFPNVQEITETLKGIKEFKDAHPLNQPDSKK